MSSRQDARALPPPYRALHSALRAFLPEERVIIDPLRRLALGTDASFYRMTPQLVVQVRTPEEVQGVLREAGARQLSVTFRAAGTSLSGQSVTDSVLVMVTGGWRRHQVLDAGERIALESGVIGADANALLAPFGRKLGPDPASIGACMVGGIVANNASGMCCGTAQNSYRTVESMKLVLWDGTTLDTADAASRRAFAERHPELLGGLAAIRDEIEADGALKRRIEEKYRIKNTTGFSLNAFVDFQEPLDILLHLMVGSEGTLAFISEVTFRTVPELAHKASALVAFPDIETAARATMRLKTGPVSAVEMMDRASLSSVAGKPGLPAWLGTVGPDTCALLVETRAPDAAALQQQMAVATALIHEVPTLFPVEFTAQKAEYERLWDVRRGLFPAVGGARPIGTTVVIEDVAFPMEHLAAGTVELQRLMRRHGYDEGIIFGHALDGNLHFVFTPDFALPGEVTRYARFMDEVCEMVAVKYGGSLKGEHGTGRNVAPFVELEWGQKAYGLMRRLKGLFDPHALLNPGVIITDDPKSHLANLKPLTRAHPIVDRCIECGFCEPKCPSRQVTLSPRQRIVTQREIARLRNSEEEPNRLARLEADYRYFGEDTCATCGMCSTACPVGIDTGQHTKWMRAQRHGADPEKAELAQAAAGNFASLLGGVRTSLGLAKVADSVVGTGTLAAVSRGLNRALGSRIPVWHGWMPTAARPHFEGTARGSDLKVVYFPSCLARTMGPAIQDPDKTASYEAMLSLLLKAGCDVAFPEALDSLCCGLAFESKGFPEQADAKSRALEQALMAVSEGGKHPILFDTSPCTARMRKFLQERLTLFDPVDFIHRFLLERLSLTKVPGPIALHVPCSAQKAGLGDAFRAVANACAEKVTVPAGVGCCGFAGDRGFSHPEVNASALASLAAALPKGTEAGYSSSRTCEIGLSLHGGIPYRSLAVLVDRCASPRTDREKATAARP